MPGALWPAQGFSIIIEETKMQKILLTGLLILLLAVPAPAAEKEVAGVFFPLPEGWSVVEEKYVRDDFHLAAPAGRPPDGHRRDGGRRCGPCPRPDSGGTGLRDRRHGRSCGAGGTVQLPPSRKTVRMASVFLAQSNGRFILVSVLGELPPAVPLLEGMRCPADPGLVLR